MKLTRATFLSVSGLPDMTAHFGDVGTGLAHDVTAVTGPAASGKTRLLEAIVAAKEVIAAYGPPVLGSRYIRKGARGAKVELTFVLDAHEQQQCGGIGATVEAEALFGPTTCSFETDEAFASLLESYEHDPKVGKLDYFPANRVLPPLGAAQGLGAFEQRIWRLRGESRKFGFVPRYLIELRHDSAARERFTAALAGLSTTVRYVGPGDGDPLTCFSSRGSDACGLTELSTSEVDAVVIAATSSLVRHDRSIVLFDRPENGADERSMAAWLTGLRGLAPDVQVIIATESPALLACLPPGAVVELGASGEGAR